MIHDDQTRYLYHRPNVMNPLVPVCRDRRTSLNGSGELEGARGAVVVTSNLRVGHVRDRVTLEVRFRMTEFQHGPHVLGGPRTLDSDLTGGWAVRSPDMNISQRD